MDDIPVPIDSGSKRFIPQLRLFIRQKGLAYSTEKTYLQLLEQGYNLRTIQELLGHSFKGTMVVPGVLPPTTLVHPEHRMLMSLREVVVALSHQ